MESSTIWILGVLTFWLLVQGASYAAHIYYTPPEQGHTVYSVATGVSMLFTGCFLILTILYYNRAMTLLNVILALIGVLAVIGGPMFFSQVYRKRRIDSHVNEIHTNKDFTR
jgi:hypothetical protein